MDINLDVLRLAQSLAQHAAQRQALIAQNVANADTPGYRAVDLTRFSDAYDGTDPDGLSLAATRPGHLNDTRATGGYRITDATVIGAEAPNGNTVSLEDQMLRSAEVRQTHDLAMGVYSKTLDILRLTVRRGG